MGYDKRASIDIFYTEDAKRVPLLYIEESWPPFHTSKINYVLLRGFDEHFC